jgi:diguanylate cyclase
MLVCVTQKIKKRLRTTDFLARIGGEEFIALLVDCDVNNVKKMNEQLRQDIARCETEVDGNSMNVTVSCGIAQLSQHENYTDFFARADAALYRAKADGRNRVCVAEAQTL